MKPSDSKKPWKGYTLEQLQMRRVVNSALVQISTERLKMNAQGASDDGPVNQWMGRISTIADYAVYAFKAYRLLRRIIGMFR